MKFRMDSWQSHHHYHHDIFIVTTTTMPKVVIMIILRMVSWQWQHLETSSQQFLLSKRNRFESCHYCHPRSRLSRLFSFLLFLFLSFSFLSSLPSPFSFLSLSVWVSNVIVLLVLVTIVVIIFAPFIVVISILVSCPPAPSSQRHHVHLSGGAPGQRQQRNSFPTIAGDEGRRWTSTSKGNLTFAKSLHLSPQEVFLKSQKCEFQIYFSGVLWWR